MSDIKNKNWTVDRNDPDHWLKIPEFNVLPQDVNFEGFAYPIIGPKNGDIEVRYSILGIVKAVRCRAKMRFKTLSDLKTCYKALIDRTGIFDAHYTDEPVTTDELFAFRFESVFYNLDRCSSFLRTDKQISFVAMAYAGAELAEMMLERNDSISTQQIRTEIARQGGIARHATDPKQVEKSLVLECWNMWQTERTRYASKAAFSKDMLSKFESLQSQRVIERWCLDWERQSARTVRT